MSVYDKSEGASLHFDVPSVFCVTACGYFGSGTCLSPKRLAVILEAPCAYFGSAQTFRMMRRRNNYKTTSFI